MHSNNYWRFIFWLDSSHEVAYGMWLVTMCHKWVNSRMFTYFILFCSISARLELKWHWNQTDGSSDGDGDSVTPSISHFFVYWPPNSKAFCRQSDISQWQTSELSHFIMQWMPSFTGIKGSPRRLSPVINLSILTYRNKMNGVSTKSRYVFGRNLFGHTGIWIPLAWCASRANTNIGWEPISPCVIKPLCTSKDTHIYRLWYVSSWFFIKSYSRITIQLHH